MRGGGVELRLPPEERDVLRSLPAQIREALDAGKADPNDPAIARLNPSAYRHDPEFDIEFHRLMGEDLDEGRRQALQTLEDTVDATRLDDEQALGWMRALNDARLLLGTRLDVSEDPAERRVPADDPRAPGFALYDYLSYLVGELVEALDRF
jgi:hypothetical protein